MFLVKNYLFETDESKHTVGVRIHHIPVDSGQTQTQEN